MKKLINVILSVSLIVLVAAACSSSGKNESGVASSSPAESAGKRTYFINPKMTGPAYWAAAEKGARQAGIDLDIEVIYNASTEADSAKQINLIQDMLTRQVLGMAVAPNDGQAVRQIINKAMSDGINVVTWDADSPESDREYYVAAITDKLLGEIYAQEIADQLGGKGNVAFMVAGLGAQNQIDQMDGAKAYLESSYPDIKIVTTLASNDDQQKAFENAQNLLQSYQDLDGIIGFAAGELPAAAEAVEQAVADGSLQKGKIKIVGITVPSLGRDYVKNDTIEKIIVWDPGKLGYVTVYVLDQLAQGNEITDGMEVPNVGPITVEGQNIYIGTIEVTKDNVDDYDF